MKARGENRDGHRDAVVTAWLARSRRSEHTFRNLRSCGTQRICRPARDVTLSSDFERGSKTAGRDADDDRPSVERNARRAGLSRLLLEFAPIAVAIETADPRRREALRVEWRSYCRE